MPADPIVDSSPLQSIPPSRPPIHPPSDSEDELLDDFVTQPTLPLAGARSHFFAPRRQQPPRATTTTTSAFATQPTQVLDTPQKNKKDQVHIQVAASSPAVDRSSRSPAMSEFATSIAPPGTLFRRPPPVPRPVPMDLSDDPPVEDDSEEEPMRSNIKPSVFESGTSTSFGTTRVAETPQKAFNLSSFAYDSSTTRKRPADGDAGGSGADKRACPPSRQTGPARARPIDDDISLEDIPDFQVRRSVQRLKAVLPSKPLNQLLATLQVKKGNYQDTLDYLTSGVNGDAPIELSDDELLISSVAPAKPAAKRGLKVPNKSIQEKFSSIKTPIPAPAVDSEPKKRGRLMRGRRNPSPSPNPSPQKSAAPSKKRVVHTLDSDEEEDVDEGIILSSGPDSDSEAEGEHSDVGRRNSNSLLEFFNTSSVQAMMDLTNQKEDVVQAVFAHRPFRSFNDIEQVSLEAAPANGKKARKPKVTLGEKLLDFASNMWSGYQAVDQLVTKCQDLGKPIAEAVSHWGVDIFGTTTEGEVALTKIDESRSDNQSVRDSGIGTPRSESELDDITKRSRHKPKFLKKPKIMSDDFDLKDYQLVGLNWLSLLWSHGMSGILADDMGLGKTCQVISFLSHLIETGSTGPHLVIVPGSTLENWLREFQRFSPKLMVEPYYGSQASRGEQQERILDNVSSINVLVTTYDLAYKKFDNAFLRKIKPGVCVFDEGHVLKNSTTQRYKNLMRIPAKFRLLLTGTPLQNNLGELASILAFIMPDVFKDLEEDLAFVFKHRAKTSDSDHAALLSSQRINRARNMMTPFVLRRKKAQVLQHLPEKICRVEYCELTESQSQIYSEYLEKQRQVLLDRAAGTRQTDHTNMLMRLRQAAIHPLLFRKRYDDTVIRKMSKACIKETAFMNSNPDVIFEELDLYTDFQCHQLCLKYPKHLGRFALKNDEWMDSGKVQKLVELLVRFKENGDRVLIFSQFTSAMDILESVFENIDMGFFRLDGQTPIAERQDMLDAFYEDTSTTVFMLSTKSGGAGINLACANKVIIFDASFNPQDDIQAENRAHRVGQTRDVEVIRLVTKGTVEEQIHALGVSKLELDKLVAGDDGETAASEKKLSAVEEKGVQAVEAMLMAELNKRGSEKTEPAAESEAKEPSPQKKGTPAAKKRAPAAGKKETPAATKKKAPAAAKKETPAVEKKAPATRKKAPAKGKGKAKEDLKDEYLDGLRAAGLDVAKA